MRKTCLCVGMVRIKTSITLEKKFLDWIKQKMEDKVFASRSHAVEYALKQLMDRESEERRRKRT